MIRWRSRRSGTSAHIHAAHRRWRLWVQWLFVRWGRAPWPRRAARRSERRAGAVPFSPRRVMWGTSCLMSSFITWHVTCEKKVPKKKPQIGMLAILAAPAKKKPWTPGTQKEKLLSLGLEWIIDRVQRLCGAWARSLVFLPVLPVAGKRIAPA